MQLLIAVPLRPKMSYTESYLDYSTGCVWRTLWSLLAILKPNSDTLWRRNGVSEAVFLSQPTGPTRKTVPSTFVPTTSYFWQTSISPIKSDIGSSGALLHLQALDSDRPHGHRSPVAWITRELPIILAHTCGLRSFLFAPSPWSQQHKSHLSNRADSRR